MPKPGMTGITLRKDVAELVRSKAAAANQGLNDYLLSLMMGPSLPCTQDRPGTVPTLTIPQNQHESDGAAGIRTQVTSARGS